MPHLLRSRRPLLGTALLLGAAAGLGASTCEPTSETFFLTMRDGVELATEVWTVSSSAPVVVMRTPYGRYTNNGYAASFNAEGWAAVGQDVRGTGESGGVFLSPYDDAWGDNQDGVDTVEWAALENFSNGEVCLYGYSALTLVNYTTAGAAPEHLRCAYTWVGTGDIYAHAVWQGGAYREELATRWLATLHADEALAAIQAAPLSTDPLWANVRLKDRYGSVNVPIYHVGGWFDIFGQGTVDAFVGIQSTGGEGARGRQKLLMGPWSHDHHAGELVFENAGHPDGEELRWFQRWLDGAPNGVDTEPPVRYYLMGDSDLGEASIANRWVDTSTWPPASTPTSWYLRPDGVLSRTAPGAQDGADGYTFDPADPVPTLGGANLFIENGSYDQFDTLLREDVLVYETTPLTQAVVVAGRLRARLYVSSSAVDTDFTVKLMDVYPDDRYMLLNDGILRMRFREGQDHEAFMTPGEVYAVDVDLWSTAIAFEPGHRIAVAISSSNSPRFDVNPNNGGVLFGDAAPVVAQQTVYHDATRPSAIILPIVPLP